MTTTIKNAALVGAGGFAGSALRYLAGTAVQHLCGRVFPLGILAVNVTGCLLIGFLGGLTETGDLLGRQGRLFVLVGCLGGFTTFSTFGYDTLGLLRSHHPGLAGLNVALHLVCGLGAVAGGFALARALQNV